MVGAIYINADTNNVAYVEYWVSESSGSDSNSGTLASPFQTIQFALTTAASSPALINVLPGTYSETVLTTKSHQWIVSTGGSSDTFWTLGISNVFSLGSSAGVTNTTIKGFSFLNQTAPGSGQIISVVQKVSNSIIDDCVFRNIIVGSASRTTMIRVSVNNDITIQNCIFDQLNGRDSGGTVIGITGVYIPSNNATARIKDCVFSNIVRVKPISGTVPPVGGAVSVANVGATAIITGCKFVGNDIAINNAATTTTGGNVTAIRNAIFTRESASHLYCASSMVDMNVVNNDYCGGVSSFDVACGITPAAPNYSPADVCNVCGGDNSDFNCAGECFTPDPTPCPTPVTRYVAPSALGTGDGSSPANAMGSIQSAIDASANFGDIVQLLNGTYVVNSALSFLGKTITVQGNTSNPICVVVVCNGTSTAFKMQQGEKLFATLSHLTIKNCGRAFQSLNFSSGTLDTVIVDNATNVPASFAANGIVINSIFKNSISAANGIITAGGTGTWSVNVTNTTFVNNQGNLGVFVSTKTLTFLTNNVLVNNSCISGLYGGFVFESGTIATFSNNVFTNTGLASNSSGSSIVCLAGNAGITVGLGNTFCGNGPSPYGCGASFPAALFEYGTFQDSCSVCNGTISRQDCNGICFSGNTCVGC